MPEGQRLQWWQEEKQERGLDRRLLPEAVMTPIALAPAEEILPEERDIGEELEAEARARAASNSSASVAVAPQVIRSFTATAGQRTAGKQRRIEHMAPLLIPLILSLGLLYNLDLIARVSPWEIPTWLPLFWVRVALLVIPLEIAAIALLTFRSSRSASEKPAVTLSPQGITVCTQLYDFGLIPWEEIGDIRVEKTRLTGSCIGIMPKNAWRLARRVPESLSTTLFWNDFFVRYLIRPLRLSVSTITIFEEELPVSVEEMLTQIAAYDAAHQGEFLATQLKGR